MPAEPADGGGPLVGRGRASGSLGRRPGDALADRALLGQPRPDGVHARGVDLVDADDVAQGAGLEFPGHVAEARLVGRPQARPLGAQPRHVDVLEVQQRRGERGLVQPLRHVQAHHVRRARQVVRVRALRVHVLGRVPEGSGGRFIGRALPTVLVRIKSHAFAATWLFIGRFALWGLTTFGNNRLLLDLSESL